MFFFSLFDHELSCIKRYESCLNESLYMLICIFIYIQSTEYDEKLC